MPKRNGRPSESPASRLRGSTFSTRKKWEKDTARANPFSVEESVRPPQPRPKAEVHPRGRFNCECCFLVGNVGLAGGTSGPPAGDRQADATPCLCCSCTGSRLGVL